MSTGGGVRQKVGTPTSRPEAGPSRHGSPACIRAHSRTATQGWVGIGCLPSVNRGVRDPSRAYRAVGVGHAPGHPEKIFVNPMDKVSCWSLASGRTVFANSMDKVGRMVGGGQPAPNGTHGISDEGDPRADARPQRGPRPARLYDLGPISRAEIARLTGLTRTTVGELVAELETEGLAREVGRGPSTGGKAPTLVSLVDDARHVVALDLGERTFTGGPRRPPRRAVPASVARDLDGARRRRGARRSSTT